MNVTALNNKIVTERICPNCDYIVSQKFVELAWQDYSCTCCQKRKLSEFEIYSETDGK